MTLEGDQEAFLYLFECSVRATGWPESLIPYLVGPAQKAVDTFPVEEVSNYLKMCEAMLNLSSEAYC